MWHEHRRFHASNNPIPQPFSVTVISIQPQIFVQYNDSRPNNDRVVVDCDTDGNRPSGSYPCEPSCLLTPPAWLKLRRPAARHPAMPCVGTGAQDLHRCGPLIFLQIWQYARVPLIASLLPSRPRHLAPHFAFFPTHRLHSCGRRARSPARRAQPGKRSPVESAARMGPRPPGAGEPSGRYRKCAASCDTALLTK